MEKPTKIPLEDNYEDIIQKARRGWGLSVEKLCGLSGISTEAWAAACEGIFDEPTARALAPILKLAPAALVAIGRRAWEPAPVKNECIHQVNTPFRDMRVNAYLLHDPSSKDAVIFDTGTDADPLIRAVREKGLHLRAICLTHAHPDHIADLQTLRQAFPDVPCFCPAKEIVDNATPADPGIDLRTGSLRIEARSTPGHSPGGTTYVLTLAGARIAIVGDALFAGSMGGAANAWASALETNTREILSLPGNTILCPGHGPMTTVAEERTHNPFSVPKDERTHFNGPGVL